MVSIRSWGARSGPTCSHATTPRWWTCCAPSSGICSASRRFPSYASIIPLAMPQYAVGHLDRGAAIEARMAALPALALAGTAYRGVGVPDCVRSGEADADGVLAATSTATG